LASSGGHLFGKNTISSETFVWRDHPYETTPELMKTTADELFSAGITRIGYHGFPYEYMDRPDPGWFPFSTQYELTYTFSEQLNSRNPFWPYLKPLNDYMARVQSLSQSGHSVSRVALYSHRLYYPSWMPVDEDYPLEYSLMANGYNFDFINEDTLVHYATVENHELHTPGSVYPSLVLRNETRISLQLAEKLQEFAKRDCPSFLPSTCRRKRFRSKITPATDNAFRRSCRNSRVFEVPRPSPRLLKVTEVFDSSMTQPRSRESYRLN
jgi:hypothetical protein